MDSVDFRLVVFGLTLPDIVDQPRLFFPWISAGTARVTYALTFTLVLVVSGGSYRRRRPGFRYVWASCGVVDGVEGFP